MKKIVAVVAVMTACSFGAFAQEGKPATQPQHHDAQVEKKDEIVLKDGKLQSKVDGKFTPVEKDITLKNGTVVLANGTVKTPDGKTVTLKEGDVVSADGKVWNKKEAHDQKVMQGNMEAK